MRFRSALSFVAAAPLLLGASPPLHLQPSSGWVLDYADDSCRLIRTFGQGPTETKLEFESVAPGEMSMLASGLPVRGLAFPPNNVSARFIPGQDAFFTGNSAQTEAGMPAALWLHVPFMTMKNVKDGAPKIVSVKLLSSKDRPPPIDLAKRDADRADERAFANQITELQIQARAGNPVYLETGSLGEAMKSFDACMRDLETSWGVDPNVEDKIARRPWVANPAAWFSSGDYPSEAIRLGQESQVSFRLLVDASGKVTGCKSLSHYDAPQFNTTVCDVLKRVHLAPAELADGTKVASYYTNTVVFRIAN